MRRIQGFSNISGLINIIRRYISEMCIIKTEEPNIEKKRKKYKER